MDTVSHVKDKVEKEREESRLREEGLQAQLRDKVKKGQKIQEELSIQLRCAGRSYAQILDANKELEKQMYIEIDKREDQIENLQKEIKKRDEIIRTADAPWKEEIAKRELKLLKLKETNEDLKKRVIEEQKKIPPIHVAYKKQIVEKEAAMEQVVLECGSLRDVIQENMEAYEIELERVKAPYAKQIIELQRTMREMQEAADDKEATLKRQIKKLENEKVGLQKELDKVDHTPYERKIDTLQDGFNRLVKDFEIKTQLNTENVAKMREGFETVIKGLDQQIQMHEVEHKRRLAPYLEEIEAHKTKIEKLELRIEEMREGEADIRAKEAAIQKDLRQELTNCKDAVDLYLKSMTQAQRELEEAKAVMEGDNGPWKKMKAYEKRLEEVTLECAQMIHHKDLEIMEKTAIIARLQKKVHDDTKRFEEFASLWDGRVQEKEKGYNKSVAELAFAEGQIIEERKRTDIEREKVKARERDIERLKNEHTEELRIREKYRAELDVIIAEREREIEVESEKRYVVQCQKLKLETEFDAFKRRNEERVADLRTEMERRDRLKDEVDKKLVEAQEEIEKARVDWEDKKRELEVYIRTRDRTILALKNELEFLNDNWEIKYTRLVNLYEKLQKKFEATVGPHGAQEAYKRAMALKQENEILNTTIHELRDIIQKQKKVIRGLQLDLDQLMKETADLIAEKERGIAEMAGDYAKLENKYRDEQLLRKRLLKQKDAERLALAETFQARVEQLEQIMEAMRFNDRQELLDKIKLWKKNYERVCLERDEVEEYYKDLVSRKDLQLKNMIIENDEEREKTEKAIESGETALKESNDKWKRLLIEEQDKVSTSDEKIIELEKELGKAKIQHERAKILNERPKEDPMIAILKAKIKELESNLQIVEEGKHAIIQENMLLAVKTEDVAKQQEDVHAIYRPQLAEKDRAMKEMHKKHDDLKEILKLEMIRAQQTCKDIEEQVKRFPDPFIDEIQEMKDKYSQMQAGMQKIQVENLHLAEENKRTKKELEKEIKDLEKSLGLAKTLLHEVSTLEALKHLHTSEFKRGELEELGLFLPK